MITFDEGSDAAACCGETAGFSPDQPDVRLPGKDRARRRRIGTVLLSPLIKPGTVSTVEYNHYSLLRTIEDIFGLLTSATPCRQSGPSARTCPASGCPPRRQPALASRARRNGTSEGASGWSSCPRVAPWSAWQATNAPSSLPRPARSSGADRMLRKEGPAGFLALA